jgi:hypothetical protein
VAEAARNHYQVLGVPRTAETREIKAAYRKAARHSHPDRGGDPAEFRLVTLAFETLGDPAKRAAYDRSYGTSPRTGSAPGSAAGTAWAAGPAFRTSAAPPPPRSSTASDPARFHPPYDGSAVPLLPESVAARAVHGAPRKRGLFGAQARLIREATTADLLIHKVLAGIPSARLVNGLHSPADNGYLDHVVLAGYRMAVVGSMLLPEGAYRWTGQSLVHGSKVVEPPRLIPAVRAMQAAFPECNVTGWIVLHSPNNNEFQPVVDYARGSEPDGSDLVHVANRSRLVRELRHFLSSGPVPEVVDVDVLARLLGGMY